MNEALQAAAADHGFQFFLARLFGTHMRQTSEIGEIQGYGWRGHLYITKYIERPLHPKPSSDSQHTSRPDF